MLVQSQDSLSSGELFSYVCDVTSTYPDHWVRSPSKSVRPSRRATPINQLTDQEGHLLPAEGPRYDASWEYLRTNLSLQCINLEGPYLTSMSKKPDKSALITKGSPNGPSSAIRLTSLVNGWNRVQRASMKNKFRSLANFNRSRSSAALDVVAFSQRTFLPARRASLAFS